MSDVVTEKRSTATASTRETEPTVVAAISSGEGQSMREQAIRERADEIWEQEGRPDGKDLDHWLRALKPRSLPPRRGKPAAPSLRRTKRAVEVKKPTQTALLTKVDFRPSAHPYHQLAAVNLRR